MWPVATCHMLIFATFGLDMFVTAVMPAYGELFNWASCFGVLFNAARLYLPGGSMLIYCSWELFR